MNTISDFKKKIIQNKILIIIILIISIVASCIHYKNQTVRQTSHFTTLSGKIDTEYLKEMLVFNDLDTTYFSLPVEKLIEYSSILEDISIEPFVGNSKLINHNITLAEKKECNNLEIQNIILDLINHNKAILSHSHKILSPYNEKLFFISKELKKYQTVLDSLSISKHSKRYLRLEKRVYELQKEKINILNKNKATGQYFILSPISNFKIIKLPFILFVFIYLVLGVVVFILFSNKKNQVIDS